MASRSAVHKDDEFFKRVIDKCWPRIKEDLHPIYVLDILQRDGFLEYRDVRDIRDSKVTSEMNEQILRQFRAKGKAGYEKFKKCLEECKQQDLADYLTSTERERAEELNRNTGRRADQETDRIGNVKETTVGFSQLSIGQAKVGNGNQASQDTTVGSGNQGQTLTVDETDNVPSEKGTVTAVQPQSALSDGPSNDHSVGDRASGKEDRDKRLKEIFESEKVMRGRLKVLTDGNIKDLLDSCDQEARYRGGSGEVFVSKEKIPGLNMHIVVKKVKSEKGHTASKIGSLPSEKLNARILHFAIVPLLGISEDVENRTYYLLSPYMENGNLNQAIEEDCRRDNVVLDVSCRVKIMYQIASAIDFLHTPVKDIRGIIIHRDIKTLNIVLDKNNNARLTDFGLAQELKEGQDSTETTSTRPAHTPGYSRRTQEISGHNDYLAFGVVIRELLTGKKPIIEHGKNPKKVTMLKDLSERIIKQDSLAMWKNLDPNLKILEQLFKLSKMCIKEKEVTSEKVLKDVMDILRKVNAPRWENTTQSRRCEMCLENDVNDEVKDILTHHHCKENMKVCASCIRNFYSNPIRCHSCDREVYPRIGHGWAALLIAGDDENPDNARSFRTDIDKVCRVITSKCPLVMGVSVDNAKIIYPGNETKKRIKEAAESLQEVKDMHTLLVYVSSHYNQSSGGFELRSKEEYLAIEELQSLISTALDKVTEKKRAVVFLDCCSAPALDMSFQDSDLTVIQINACNPTQKAVLLSGGSLFTRIFLQCLTRAALGEECLNGRKCDQCEMKNYYITPENLVKYIQSHLKCYNAEHSTRCVMNTRLADYDDLAIGYVINYQVDLEFTYRLADNKDTVVTVQQGMFHDFSELQDILFNKFLELKNIPEEEKRVLNHVKFHNMLSVEIEKGPKNRHIEKLTSLESVMAAWNAKRELVVSLRVVHEIIEGIVGVFLPTVKPILDFLGDSFDKMEKDYATIYVIKWNDLESMIDKVQEQASAMNAMESFFHHLSNLEAAFQEEESDGFEELHLVFPCVIKDETRKHKSDFLCFQLKK